MDHHLTCFHIWWSDSSCGESRMAQPLHYVMTNPKTGKMQALSEVKQHQQHMKKMRRAPAELRPLV